MKSSKLYSLDIIKAFGIILVINSHHDDLYNIPFIGTGGTLGNSLFFLASGIGLGYGWSLHGQQKPIVWFQRRLLRIYPSLLILNSFALFLSVRSFTEFTPEGLFSYFIYPTNYFFIAAIVLFYIPGYALLRLNSTRAYILALILSLLIYFIWYLRLDLSTFSIEGGGYFRWIFYFIVFLIGLLFSRVKSISIIPNAKNNKISSFIDFSLQYSRLGLACSAILVLFAKVLFNLGFPDLFKFQFLIHCFTLALTWFIFMFAELYATQISSRINLNNVIIFLSSITLQLYLLDYYSGIYIEFINNQFAYFALNLPAEIMLRIVAVILLWVSMLYTSVLLFKLSKNFTKLFVSRT